MPSMRCSQLVAPAVGAVVATGSVACGDGIAAVTEPGVGPGERGGGALECSGCGRAGTGATAGDGATVSAGAGPSAIRGSRCPESLRKITMVPASTTTTTPIAARTPGRIPRLLSALSCIVSVQHQTIEDVFWIWRLKSILALARIFLKAVRPPSLPAYPCRT